MKCSARQLIDDSLFKYTVFAFVLESYHPVIEFAVFFICMHRINKRLRREPRVGSQSHQSAFADMGYIQNSIRPALNFPIFYEKDAAFPFTYQRPAVREEKQRPWDVEVFDPDLDADVIAVGQKYILHILRALAFYLGARSRGG